MENFIDIEKYKNIPGFTVITAAVSGVNDNRDISFIAELPLFIVFYGDYATTEKMRELRKKHKLSHMTHIHTLDNVHFSYKSLILRTLNENPFRSKQFAWIDPKIQRDSETYTIQTVSNILRMIDVIDSAQGKFRAYIVRGGVYDNVQISEKLFVFGEMVGRIVFDKMNNSQTSRVLFSKEVREILPIVFSYGQESDILDNFVSPNKNLMAIYHSIQLPFLDNGNNQDAYLCSNSFVSKLLSDENEAHSPYFVDCLFKHYVAAYYVSPPDAIEYVNIIRCLRNESADFEKSYQMNAGLYDSQLEYVKYL